jgi:hypothetical protein
MLRAGVLVILPVSLALAAPTTQPGVQSLKQREYLQQMTEKAELPTVGPMRVSEAVHIELRAGRIVASSLLKTDGWLRVKLPDQFRICTLQFPKGRFLEFTLDDFSDPRNVYMQTDILTAAQQAQIAGSWEFGDRERFVTLMEKYPSMDEGGRPLPGQTTLRVQEMTDNGDQPVDLVLSAPDLATLAREHPDEVRLYVRPVLEEIDAEAILQPDPHVQWQIFGPFATPDPATIAAVRRLLPLLDASSFAERQSAVTQLVNLKTPGAIALMHVDSRALSPEQIARIAEILKPYHTLSPDQADQLSQQSEFLLDCLASDDPELRRLACRQLKKVVKSPVDFDPDAVAAVRQSQLASLRRRWLTKSK